MKHFCLCLAGLLIAGRLSAQDGFPNYYRYANLVEKADSAYRAGQYRAAAEFFSRAVRMPVEKGIDLPYNDLNYRAAGYWAKAGVPDSAFFYLGSALKSGFTDVKGMEGNPDLSTLKADLRWDPLISSLTIMKVQSDLAKKNYLQRTTFLGGGQEVLFNPPNAKVKGFLFNDDLPFISVNFQNFRIFFRGDSYAAKHLERVKNELSVSLSRSLAVLGISAHSTGTNVVVVEDKMEMKNLTGFSVGGGLALSDLDLLFLVWNGSRRMQAKHEFFHVISNQVWGKTHSRLLNEGGAVYADNECVYNNPIYTVNAMLLREKRFLNIQELIDDFDHVAQKQEVAAYLQSAAIFKYLFERFGREKMKVLWKKGFDSFQQIYGISVKELQGMLEQKLKQTAVPKDANIEKILSTGCG